MIRVHSTSLACIFAYSDAIDRRDLVEYLKDKGFNIPRMKREEIFTSSGIPVGEMFAELPILAYKEDDIGNKIDVLHNNHTRLIGFPISSFITVVSQDINAVYSNFELIYGYLQERNLHTEISIYEATFTGLIEKEDLKERIKYFFVTDKLNNFSKVFEQVPTPVSYRVRGDDPQKDGWYDLVLDTAASDNPKLSLLRLVIRMAEYTNYRKLEKIIRKIVDEVIV